MAENEYWNDEDVWPLMDRLRYEWACEECGWLNDEVETTCTNCGTVFVRIRESAISGDPTVRE